MTVDERFERTLPTILTDLYLGPTPDYRDDLLWQTARTSQRPAWRFPGRWLPMADLVTERVAAPRIPWRTIAVALVILAVLIAGTVAFVGSQQPKLPPPFGVAGNGVVAFGRDGDLYTADPRSGTERLLIGGPSFDAAPRFSPDGTHIIFQRAAPALAVGSDVMVVAADGSGLTSLTSEPLDLFLYPMAPPYTFAPDGRTVAIAAKGPDRGPGILIAAADGSTSRWFAPSGVGTLAAIREPAFRPTDGNELLVTGDRTDGGPIVFTMDINTGEVLDIVVNGTPAASLDTARWSPDGQRISYATWSNDIEGLSVRTHIVAPDGTGNHLLTEPPGVVYDIGGAWSNDGSRMFVVRGFTADWGDSRAAIVPTSGSDTGAEVPHDGPFQSGCCYAWAWSPDDTMILGKPIAPSGVPGGQVIVDAASATLRSAPWEATDDPVWQRVAP